MSSIFITTDSPTTGHQSFHPSWTHLRIITPKNIYVKTRTNNSALPQIPNSPHPLLSRPVPVPSRPVPSRPVPSCPVPSRPVPSRPVPSRPVPCRHVPSRPVTSRPVPCRPVLSLSRGGSPGGDVEAGHERVGRVRVVARDGQRALSGRDGRARHADSQDAVHGQRVDRSRYLVRGLSAQVAAPVTTRCG